MTDNTDPAKAVKSLAAKYRKAQEARDKALEDLTAAMRAADAAGAMSRNEIQRVTGLARQTVYRALDNR
jgi:DNA-binding phage protein